jgi:site-specific DNA-methyltransferase (adenine-specific)
MGKDWDRTGIANNVSMWRECLRVLKPGGHLLAFSGSRTYHRMACAIEDAGFAIRDQLMWIFGSGFPKSHNIDPFSLARTQKTFDGWGTALKPAHEPICLARKPFIGAVAENLYEHGTGAINIDGCRIATVETLRVGAGGLLSHVRDEKPYPSSNRIGEASAEKRYTEEGGTNFSMTPGIRGGDPVGRWPANIIHDGSDEVISAFPDAPGQLAKSSDAQRTRANCYGALSDNGKEYKPRADTDRNAARFFYCAKASKDDRDEGLSGFQHRQRDESRKEGNPGGDNPRNRGLQPRANHHPTVKPTELMRYLCRLITPSGGTVLDPFMGSGSTGKAAAKEGLNLIGIEREEEYFEIACARIRNAQRQPDMFHSQANCQAAVDTANCKRICGRRRK